MGNKPPNYRDVHVFDPIHNGADECECGLTADAAIHESDEAYEKRMRPRIVNAPERVWLQVGCDDEVGEIDWKELSHSYVSWCNEKIHNTDIEYVRASVAAPRAMFPQGDWQHVQIKAGNPRVVAIQFETAEQATEFINTFAASPANAPSTTPAGEVSAAPVVDEDRELAQRLRTLLLSAFITGHSHGPSNDYQVQLKFKTLKESQQCHTIIEALTHPEYRESFIKQGVLAPFAAASLAAPVGSYRNEEGEEETRCANCAEKIIKCGDNWIHKYGWNKKCISEKIVATPSTVPSDAARRAAEETHKICDELAPEIPNDSTSYAPSVERIAAIISKHFPSNPLPGDLHDQCILHGCVLSQPTDNDSSLTRAALAFANGQEMSQSEFETLKSRLASALRAAQVEVQETKA